MDGGSPPGINSGNDGQASASRISPFRDSGRDGGEEVGAMKYTHTSLLVPL